jgi:hypothetical protein
VTSHGKVSWQTLNLYRKWDRWLHQSLAKCSREITSRRFRKQIVARRRLYRIATCFVLIVTVAVLAAANIVAQQAPSASCPHLQPNAGGEAAAVKRIVDGIMQPYLV